MNDPVAHSPGPASPAPAAKPSKPAFTFTDPGCRTEVRLGTLLVLAAVFLWLWLGPQKASWLYLIGAPLLLVGIPIQAIQARQGRPGYPWKIGIAFTVGALVMGPGLLYRDGIGDAPLHVQMVVPLLLIAGVWVLLWWPVALRLRRSFRSEGV